MSENTTTAIDQARAFLSERLGTASSPLDKMTTSDYVKRIQSADNSITTASIKFVLWVYAAVAVNGTPLVDGTDDNPSLDTLTGLKPSTLRIAEYRGRTLAVVAPKEGSETSRAWSAIVSFGDTAALTDALVHLGGSENRLADLESYAVGTFVGRKLSHIPDSDRETVVNALKASGVFTIRQAAESLKATAKAVGVAIPPKPRPGSAKNSAENHDGGYLAWLAAADKALADWAAGIDDDNPPALSDEDYARAVAARDGLSAMLAAVDAARDAESANA